LQDPQMDRRPPEMHRAVAEQLGAPADRSAEWNSGLTRCRLVLKVLTYMAVEGQISQGFLTYMAVEGQISQIVHGCGGSYMAVLTYMAVEDLVNLIYEWHTCPVSYKNCRIGSSTRNCLNPTTGDK
jgi:hypothetical protein